MFEQKLCWPHNSNDSITVEASGPLSAGGNRAFILYNGQQSDILQASNT